MSSRITWISVVLFVMLTGVALAAGAGPSPAMLGAIKADLSKRLNVPVEQIEVASVKAQVFPDASLGLARPDEMYAQVVTPGFTVLVQKGEAQYLYTATDKAFRYGGALDSWRYSALYLQSVPNEPNLNRNLMQVSLAGTNPTLIMTGVSDYWPQPDGSMLAKSRTSRSGHELLYLAPGKRGEGKVISAGFDFTYASKSAEGDKWCALRRPTLGLVWDFVWGKTDGDRQAVQTLALPEGSTPIRTYWHLQNPVIAVRIDGKAHIYEVDLSATPLAWRAVESFFPPEREQFLLNKSETLVVKTDQVDGKPVTRVIFEWFTGEENTKVTIPNFDVKAFEVTPGHRFLLLTGVRDGQTIALTADVATGEVLPTVGESEGPVKLFLQPPDSWLKFSSAASHRLHEKGR